MSSVLTILFVIICFCLIITLCFVTVCIWNKCRSKKCRSKKDKCVEWMEISQNSENSYICFESDPITI